MKKSCSVFTARLLRKLLTNCNLHFTRGEVAAFVISFTGAALGAAGLATAKLTNLVVAELLF